MEFEFDKEIDALLRQAARGGGDVVSTNNAHLDADEISAFAENALSEKAKQRHTLHLADCARCRKILSNLISLESETGNEAVSALVKEKVVVETRIPWYRKIFAMPNLAYTMGALVLLFSGLIAFIVLQSPNNSMSGEVSQISEKSMDSKSTSSAPVMSNTNTATTSNMTTANSATVYTSNATTSSMNSSVNVPLSTSTGNTVANKTTTELKNPVNTLPKDVPIQEADKNTAKTERTQTSDLAVVGRSVKEEDKPETQNQVRSDDAEAVMKQAPKPSAAQPSLSTSGAVNDAKEKKSSSKTVETTSAGGKTFRRTNNVWYDTNYNGQSTMNITRGSDEYKKLDSGLRGIANNIGGTVVIVWKGKAYRIQ